MFLHTYPSNISTILSIFFSQVSTFLFTWPAPQISLGSAWLMDTDFLSWAASCMLPQFDLPHYPERPLGMGKTFSTHREDVLHWPLTTIPQDDCYWCRAAAARDTRGGGWKVECADGEGGGVGEAGSASGAKGWTWAVEKWLSGFRWNSMVCFEQGADEGRGQV